ncbi:MAG TPA: DUF433 domain-containing protein [Chloroflexia bacterium]|nr:DUF433 domain-containing protein [Chloroflexia bacterium]
MALALIIESDPVPLSVDTDGTVRVGGTRVTLDTVIRTFEDGASAEEIANKYPTLRLADVYSVIGYYLRHKKEMQTYLQQREAEAALIQQAIEARWPADGLRERLLARLVEREQPAR